MTENYLSGAVTDSIFEISAIHFDSSQLSEFENLFAVWMTN